MPLSIADRKHLMPHRAQRKVAAEQHVFESYVSAVMSDLVKPKSDATRKKLRRVQVALARKLRLPVDAVFPPEAAARQETPSVTAVA